MEPFHIQISSLEIADDDDVLSAREILAPSGLIGQLFLAFAAIAFLAGGVFLALCRRISLFPKPAG